MKTYKNIPVSEETHKKVMLFKIRSDARSFDEVISLAITALKEKIR